MKKWIIILLWAALLTLPALARSGYSNVRFLHLIADAPTLDLYLDGELYLEDLAFGDASLWASLPTGPHSVILVPAGEAAMRAWAGPYNVDLSDESWQTMALLEQNEQPAFVALNEDYRPIGQGETRLSILNTVSGLSSVQAMANNIELSSNLAFASPSDLPSFNLIANSYDISFLSADQRLAYIEEFVMGSNRHYLVVLAGTPDTPQALLYITNPDAPYSLDVVATEEPSDLGNGDLTLRLAHFSPGTPPLDVYLGDRLLAAGIGFAQMSEYLSIPAGEYDLRVLVSGEVSPRYTETLALATDSILSLTLTGILGHSSFDIQRLNEDYSPPAPGMARIVLYHGIATDKLIGLYANNQLVVQGLAYASAFVGAGQGYMTVDLPAGNYNFVITSDDGVIFVNAGSVVTGPGRYYLIAATGTTDVPTYVMAISDMNAVALR